MSPDRFGYLFSLVAPLISKQATRLESQYQQNKRLVVTLRYLATGEAQQSLSFGYRIGKATISKILARASEAIFQTLKDPFLKTPNCQKEWLSISKGFEDKWNFPHCLVSLGGKHIHIECPKMPGTYYYNYKRFYSIVLLTIWDCNYCFTLFDLGQYESNNDCGVLANSAMGKMMENDKLGIPAPSKLRSCSFGPLPYFFFVGDEICPLKTWLVRPLPEIFNYSLSLALLTIENIFGILAASWRIFYAPIRKSVENVEKYTLAH